MTVRSMVVAAGADRHEPTFWLSAAISSSLTALTASPDPNTYPKNPSPAGLDRSAIASKLSSTAGPIPSSAQGRLNNVSVSFPLVTG